MQTQLKTLFVDCQTGYSKMKRYTFGDFFGPVDLGLHLAGKYNSLNIGAGLLAGSIFPGSNRMIFSGFSPCWGGFFISSMGGAALVFDNLGINMLSLVQKAAAPSVLYLNRIHGEEIQLEIHPLNIEKIWHSGRGGIYSLMDEVYSMFADLYSTDPRILAAGPAAKMTDFGAIGSVPIVKGKLTHVDGWAGRGGMGSKMFREHNIAAVIYGGTHVDEDFRDRKVADQWFFDRYQKKMTAVDFDATTKYRFEPNFETGGTFGVNYASLGGNMLFFNYKSIYMKEEERTALHEKYIVNHYLKQFNDETIKTKQQKNCGEPCAALCKKMHGRYKKDYEPYQAMGPLSGIFDQRAAELINHKADMYGFDAISVGGIISWLMECMADKLLLPEDLGVEKNPVFSIDGFDPVTDSMHNAEIGAGILDSIIHKKGILDLTEGARKFARRLARKKGREVLDKFLYTSFARKGWMVPNQYWTPGVLSPMAIMGKYYMHYGKDFLAPRKLGEANAQRMVQELMLDNLGMCRFHRAWAEDMMPDIIESIFGVKDKFMDNIRQTAGRINSRNASVFWESERNIDFVYHFLKRKQTVESSKDAELLNWISKFEENKHEAALDYWYEIHRGMSQALNEFN